MAINQSNDNSVNTFNLRYSAFLGMIYVSNPESEAAIKEVKAAIGGEDEVKKGFQGSSGATASAKAIALLKPKGVTSVDIDGRISSTRVIQREVQGRKTPYLNVRLRDAEGVYNLSISLAQRGAQMLVRKLSNAQPGAQTRIKLFGTYTQKPGSNRAYGEHGASLKQDGVEIVGVSPRDVLVPLQEGAITALHAAGITDDKELFNKRRASIALDYHYELMVDVTERFARFYLDRELPVDDIPLPDADNQFTGQPAEDE